MYSPSAYYVSYSEDSLSLTLYHDDDSPMTLDDRAVSPIALEGRSSTSPLTLERRETSPMTLERRRTITMRIKGHDYTLKSISSYEQGQNSVTYRVVGGFEGVAAIVKIIDSPSKAVSDNAKKETKVLRKVSFCLRLIDSFTNF